MIKCMLIVCSLVSACATGAVLGFLHWVTPRATSSEQGWAGDPHKSQRLFSSMFFWVVFSPSLLRSKQWGEEGGKKKKKQASTLLLERFIFLVQTCW